MKLVIDANVVISALIADTQEKRIITGASVDVRFERLEALSDSYSELAPRIAHERAIRITKLDTNPILLFRYDISRCDRRTDIRYPA